MHCAMNGKIKKKKFNESHKLICEFWSFWHIATWKVKCKTSSSRIWYFYWINWLLHIDVYLECQDWFNRFCDISFLARFPSKNFLNRTFYDFKLLLIVWLEAFLMVVKDISLLSMPLTCEVSHKMMFVTSFFRVDFCKNFCCV